MEEKKRKLSEVANELNIDIKTAASFIYQNNSKDFVRDVLIKKDWKISTEDYKKLIKRFQATVINKYYYKETKITKITIQDYNQFEELVLDLTYPKGHEKAGKPLDKICIIGQSATGKTTILNFIHKFIEGILEEEINIETKKTEGKAYPKLINFPAFGVENIKQLDADEILEYEDRETNEIIDFNKTDPKEHWYSILQELKQYQAKSIDFNLAISENFKNLINIKDTKKEIDKINKKIEVWENENLNLLAELDKFLKPILEKFFLKVKTNPSSVEDLKFIPIENYKYNEDKEKVTTEIPIEFLSTGTKQILARSIPLYSIKPQNSIILIDEPENSFYPDIQKKYIDFIVESYPSNQFFFATHSPTISSSFDPWEIVELEFNDKGKVFRKKYYDGENHIDNYNIFPKYLRLDKILTKVFNFDNKNYQEQLYELAKIQSKIDYFKENNETEKRDKEIEKLKKIAKKLDWDINDTIL